MGGGHTVIMDLDFGTVITVLITISDICCREESAVHNNKIIDKYVCPSVGERCPDCGGKGVHCDGEFSLTYFNVLSEWAQHCLDVSKSDDV